MNNPAAKQLGTLVVAEKNPNGFHKGERYRFYNKSSFKMGQCADESIALTITSPPYWNAVDYDIHATNGKDWYRNREYTEFGKTYSG